MLRITLAGCGVFGEDFVETGEVFLRETDLDGCGVFFQIFSALGAGDRDDIVALRQYPGEGELRRLASFFFGDLFYLADQV